MADDQTRIIIGIDLILRNLEKTLAGLSAVEKRLQSLATLQLNSANFDRAAASAARLQQQQQRLAIQSQELANREERARQTSDRLALSRERLAAASAKAADAEAKASQKTVAEEFRRAQQVQRITEQTARQAEQQEAIRTRAAKTIADIQTREAQRGATALVNSIEQQRNALDAAAKSQEKLGNSLRSLGQGLTSVGFALTAALTAPLVALGKSSLDAAVTLDSLKRGLTAITGSAAEASTQLKRLTEIAKLPGIGFQEAIQGSIRLQAVGFSARDAEKALIEFSNAIALTGGGREELARVTTQLGQLAAKGKVLSQDLRPIIEAAPAVGTALKQAFGTVNADDIAALTGSSEEFFRILVKQLEQLPRASAGAKNAFENFKDSIFRAAAVIGDTLIPILTKLIDVALPAIEALANAFKALPFPIRASVVIVGTLLAALGPLVIVIGQLIVGIGRLTVAQAQLARQSGAAAIALEAETVAATEATVATSALSTVFKGFGGPIFALVAALTAGAAAFLLMSDAEEKSTQIDVEAEKERQERIKSLKREIDLLEDIVKAGAVRPDQEKELTAARKSADDQTRGRLALLDSEKDKIDALVAAKREQLQIDQFATQATATQAAQNIVDAINKQAKAQVELTEAKKRFAGAELEAATASNLFGARQLTVADIEAVRKKASLDSAAALDKQKTAQDEIGKQARIFIELARATGISTDALLQLARQGGLTAEQQKELAGAIDIAAQAMRDATVANNAYLASLAKADQQLIAAGDAAEAEEKRRQKLISSSGALAREASNSFKDALKFFDAFRRANPDLEDALRRQAQLTGKSISELIEESIRAKGGDPGTALRNAQVALEKALADVREAAQKKETADLVAQNETLLRANEAAFKLQLRSYREYLTTRALLTQLNLDEELKLQAKAVTEAEATRAKLLKFAGAPGIPPAERTRRQAQAAEAEKESINAQTKLADLEAKRQKINDDLANDIKEANQKQETDIRQLDIEYAELKGHIEDALKAQVAERFRVKLEQLGQAQVFITEQLTSTTRKLTTEQRVELEQARQRNQTEIDRINFIQRTSDALDVLKVSEQFVTDAKQKQRDLEDDLSFQVAFRGKQEIEAIRQRLSGEDQLKQRLLISRDIVQDEINRLRTLGQDVPRELQKFVDQINLEIKGLGELSFSDQFRLVEQEFDRFNEKRISQIEDVERAVRHRDISELEGLILIKKANGEYVDELEAQVVLLEQIAQKSNDPRLLQQAENARQTAADVRAATTEFASFGKQLRSISIDSLQRSLEDFFSSLTDRTKTAREKLLGLLEGFEQAIVNFVAKDFSRRIIESIFGTDADQQKGVGGLISKVKSLLGIGTQAAAPDLGGGAHAADILAPHAAQATATTETGAALVTAGTTAGTAMATGGTTAGTAMATSAAGFTTAIAAAATGFASAVVAAGAAFAAAVAAGGAAQAIGGAGSALAGAAATGDIISPQPRGRLVRVAEAGYPEAILTTDPRHAQRQASILREYLIQTKGLFGRMPVPEFAEGAFVTPRQAEMSMLSSLSGRPTVTPQAAAIANQTGGRQRNLRFVFVDDQRDVRNWVDSAEGDKVIVEKLTRNRPLIRRLAN